MSKAIYIAVTNAKSWGRGESEQEAVRNAAATAYNGRKEFEVIVYCFPKVMVSDAWATGEGGVSWDWQETTPEEIRDLIQASFMVGHYNRLKGGKLTPPSQ